MHAKILYLGKIKTRILPALPLALNIFTTQGFDYQILRICRVIWVVVKYEKN